MKKYYEAYDDRYKQVHDKGLAWSPNNNTTIIEDVLNRFNLKDKRILEIGCGEGRDARYLLNKGYNVLASDISEEAIKYCKENDPTHSEKYKVSNALKEEPKDKFGFIYSVACLHMFVLDEDRNKFFKYIHDSLEDDGYSLILSMGDGIKESKSDITKAFDNITRTHQETNTDIVVTTTSCRIVSFETLTKEAEKNGFTVVEQGLTKIENHFDKIMYIIIKKH